MDAALRRYLVEGERAAERYTLGTPRIAPIGQAGTTLAQRAGSSLEFKDHRGYEPGDDLRHIDWSAYARTDQLTIKLFREEITPHLDIVLDTSRSMNLEGTAKGGAAVALAAFFASAALRGGQSRTAWLMGARCAALPGSERPPSLWEGIAFEHRGDPEPILPAWKARGTRVLISDLLWMGEPLKVVRPFAERSAVAIVVQILARDDVEPPEGQSVRLVDAETDEMREIHVDAGTARRYREALARHQQNWHDACRQVGAVFVTLTAEDLLTRWELSDLVAAEVLRVQ